MKFGVFRTFRDFREDGADLDGITFGHGVGLDHAINGGLHINGNLVGLNGADGVTGLHRISNLLEPFLDRPLGNRLGAKVLKGDFDGFTGAPAGCRGRGGFGCGSYFNYFETAQINIIISPFGRIACGID